MSGPGKDLGDRYLSRAARPCDDNRAAENHERRDCVARGGSVTDVAAERGPILNLDRADEAGGGCKRGERGLDAVIVPHAGEGKGRADAESACAIVIEHHHFRHALGVDQQFGRSTPNANLVNDVGAAG